LIFLIKVFTIIVVKISTIIRERTKINLRSLHLSDTRHAHIKILHKLYTIFVSKTPIYMNDLQAKLKTPLS